MISTILGLVLAFIPFNKVMLIKITDYLAQVFSPLAGVLIGLTLQSTNFVQVYKLAMLSIVKMLFCGLIMAVLALLIFKEQALIKALIVVASTPFSVTGLMFSQQYHFSSNFYSKLLSTSLILSLLFVPLLLMILNQVV